MARRITAISLRMLCYFLLHLSVPVRYANGQSGDGQGYNVIITASPNQTSYVAGTFVTLMCIVDPPIPTSNATINETYLWQCDGCFANENSDMVINQMLTVKDSSVINCSAIINGDVYETDVPLYLQVTQASSVTNAVTILNAPNATNELHSITVNCTIHPNSTADQCVVMAVDDGGVNRTGSAPITGRMAIVTVNSLHCGVTYNIIAGGMHNNGTLVGPGSSYGNITTGACPLKANCESDDELFTETAVGIIILATFIITLVITALITVVLTRLCCKCRHGCRKKKDKKSDGVNSIKSSSLYETANNKMNTNMMCDNASTNKTVDNPVYISTGL